jgi:RHS repeat-associated protein
MRMFCRLLVLLALVWTNFANAGELVTYYHNDIAGSPVAATDARGYLMWRTGYEPFGQRIQNDPDYIASADNDRWFTSHVEDVETGLVYMQARHYDPAMGRFLSVDPVRFTPLEPQTFGRYTYASNNPYRYNDPDGEFINFVVGGVKAAVENVVIQHAEMALGVRDTFSWKDLAIDSGMGAATSGLSTIKNGARIANVIAKVATKADDAADAKKTGVVYLRKGPNGEEYVGRSNSDKLYEVRQQRHDRVTGRQNEYEILGRAEPGKDLRVLEETHIRKRGGPGVLENKRYEMNDKSYKEAGGSAEKPTGGSGSGGKDPAPESPPPPAPAP